MNTRMISLKRALKLTLGTLFGNWRATDEAKRADKRAMSTVESSCRKRQRWWARGSRMSMAAAVPLQAYSAGNRHERRSTVSRL